MSSISKFFTTDTKADEVRFTGDKLICYIPTKYKDKQNLIIDTTIVVLGIFDMEIHDKGSVHKGGIILPARISMDPSDTYYKTIDDVSYFVCEITKGNRFMTTLRLMQDQSVLYAMYTEFISLANTPKFIDYSNIHTIYDSAGPIVGKKIDVSPAIMEMLYAQAFKDAENPSIPYRLTDMTKPAIQIAFRDVAHQTSTTHARTIGGYADAGRNSALLHQSTENNIVEDYFRE